MRCPPSSSIRIGEGVQPVPVPTLPESSSAERNAWLRKGSPALNRSQAAALSPETPDAILAKISGSRSAIGFPDGRVGMNRRLRAPGCAPHGPAVNGHALAKLRDPRPAEGMRLHRDK